VSFYDLFTSINNVDPGGLAQKGVGRLSELLVQAFKVSTVDRALWEVVRKTCSDYAVVRPFWRTREGWSKTCCGF